MLSKASKRAWATRLWGFLNSGFGLWLLGAVIVTGGSAWFTYLQSVFAARDSETRAVLKVDLEIEYRM